MGIVGNMMDNYDDLLYREPSEAEALEHCEECGCGLFDGDEAYNVAGYWFCQDCIDKFRITL